MAEAITSRAIREKLTTQLMEPIPDTPAEFRARIDADIARWAPVIDGGEYQDQLAMANARGEWPRRVLPRFASRYRYSPTFSL